MSHEVSSSGMMVILTPWTHVIAVNSHAVGQTFDSKKGAIMCLLCGSVCYTWFLSKPSLENIEESLGTSDIMLLMLSEFVKLLSVAGKKFHNDPTKVLSTQGAEIDDISLVRENEHLYIINEHQLRCEPQGKCFYLIKHNIFHIYRFAIPTWGCSLVIKC